LYECGENLGLDGPKNALVLEVKDEEGNDISDQFKA